MDIALRVGALLDAARGGVTYYCGRSVKGWDEHSFINLITTGGGAHEVWANLASQGYATGGMWTCGAT